MTKILKSKTIVFMFFAALLPVLDLLGQIDMQSLVQPFLCGEVTDGECVEASSNVGQVYASIVAFIAMVLRFFTNKPLSEK